MRIKKINIKNLKGFDETGDVVFSPNINILLGSNNSGKSTIIKSCYLIQPSSGGGWPSQFISKNRRKLTRDTEIKITFDMFDPNYVQLVPAVMDRADLWERAVKFSLSNDSYNSLVPSIRANNDHPWSPISNIEPRNFVYLFFSKRKTVTFHEAFNLNNAITVKENLEDLYAKIDRISNVDYPAYSEFRNACEKILGFTVTCSLSTKGRQAGIIVSNNDYIPIDEMGEGTTNLLGLIVDLCIADNKLFLIEEIENDVHPKALKALLELIISKSQKNQFIISTHSNIVTKYLGSVEKSKIFYLEMKIKDRIPTSTIAEVQNTPEQRIRIMEDLGYEMLDFELWKAYLILEESSAERIIKDFLIPNFIPTLVNKIKTIAAMGVSDLKPKFNDFLRLFVFVHLSSAYQDKAWVIADGDQPGIDIINELKNRFKNWDPSHFRNFKNQNFENYYPLRWQEKVGIVLSIEDRKARYKAKGELVNEIMKWAIENPDEAKYDFMESAAEVIEFLKELDKQLTST